MINLEKIGRALDFSFHNRILLPIYKRTISRKIDALRKKDKISVMFIVTEVGPWKTQLLYRAMEKHERFSPVVGVSMSKEMPWVKNEVVEYMKNNDYKYIDIDVDEHATADIIFYQKPYTGCYMEHVLLYKHLNSLFCNVNYGFHSVVTDWTVNQPLYRLVWQYYFECDLGIPVPSRQRVVTGVPMQDQLMQSKEKLQDPWKQMPVKMKRIIYAPHHTIGDMHLEGLATSSFMENAFVMLELMRKYRDKVQWAFKPHPRLYRNLIEVWGQEKADAYYAEWRDAENAQLETGGYDALFAYSDAMIHDCVSFVIEYQYTKNPVMYLLRSEGRESNWTALSTGAFDLHYKGQTREDIERFIENVINGVDPVKEQREDFYNRMLIPPHGKSACENIMNAILGVEEYKGLK